MIHRKRLTNTWAVAALWATLALLSAEAIAKGGRPADRSDAAQGRAQDAADSRDVTYGRAVIFRAGHLPRHEPDESPAGKKHPAQPAHPTHYLDTTLPVIIQGAPNELALRRYCSTS